MYVYIYTKNHIYIKYIFTKITLHSHTHTHIYMNIYKQYIYSGIAISHRRKSLVYGPMIFSYSL